MLILFMKFRLYINFILEITILMFFFLMALILFRSHVSSHKTAICYFLFFILYCSDEQKVVVL